MARGSVSTTDRIRCNPTLYGRASPILRASCRELVSTQYIRSFVPRKTVTRPGVPSSLVSSINIAAPFRSDNCSIFATSSAGTPIIQAGFATNLCASDRASVPELPILRNAISAKDWRGNAAGTNTSIGLVSRPRPDNPDSPSARCSRATVCLPTRREPARRLPPPCSAPPGDHQHGWSPRLPSSQ